MRGAISQGLMLITAVVAVSACDAGEKTASPSRAPSSATRSPSSSPSSASAEQQVEFCLHLSAFASVAGGGFDLAVFDVETGETPKKRESVSTYVSGMVREGAYLSGRLPAKLEDDLLTVVSAGAKAKRRLAAGDPASDAVAGLYTGKASAAREAVTAYRGPC